MNLEELEVEVLRLSPHARAQLATKLLRSLEALSDAENERLWAEEALRRNEELVVGSLMITWIFFEKGGFLSVPIFEYLEGRFVV